MGGKGRKQPGVLRRLLPKIHGCLRLLRFLVHSVLSSPSDPNRKVRRETRKEPKDMKTDRGSREEADRSLLSSYYRRLWSSPSSARVCPRLFSALFTPILLTIAGGGDERTEERRERGTRRTA